MAVIGAFNINCSPIVITISICVTSFVVLVIRLDVENSFISLVPKFPIFLNINKKDLETFQKVMSQMKENITNYK